MRFRSLLAAFLLSFSFFGWPGSASTQEAGVTIFDNVRVLTMTEAGTLESRTVIVDGDRIAALTEPGAERRSDARVVNGSGMTLLPGLADMHVHYDEAGMGPLFLANGVTTVRQTWGNAGSFRRDALAKAGVLTGPHVYASGPIMDGEKPAWPGSISVKSPDEARGAVAAQAAAGFRAVKLYDYLDAETFAAAVEAAHGLNMQVWSHTPRDLSYGDMLALGVNSLEHLWMTQYSLMDQRPDPALPRARQGQSGWDQVEDARMPDLAARTVEAGTWNVPTLTTYTQMLEHGANAEAFFSRPETAYLPPAIGEVWRGLVTATQDQLAAVVALNRAGRPGRERWVKALYDAGAGVLVGTDTPNPFIMPGYSIHEELDNLSQAGIPNDALLRMATVEAARFLNEEGEFGVVAVGARADLILVEGDPLTDLAVLRRPAYVVLNGHLRDRATLQRELDALASRYASETD